MMNLTNLSERLSPKRLAVSLTDIFQRFPIVLFFMLWVSCVSFTYLSTSTIHDGHVWFFLFSYPSGAGVLAFAFKLWSEVGQRRVFSIIVQTVSHVLWLSAALYVSSLYDMQAFDITPIYASVALGLLIITLVFTLPFYREKNDLALWSFFQKLVYWTCWALVVPAILLLGLSLLLLSLDYLFGVPVKSEYYKYLAVFCFTIISPLMFLKQVQGCEEIHNPSEAFVSKFSVGVIHYLFLPLLGTYLITLYVYTAKIIITWQLPVGWVSSLVSFSVVGLVLITYLLYPTLFSNKHKFDHSVVHLLPVLVLPLLVLMSVGIWRRIDDYGITNARLYLVAFNVWCYALCITMTLTKVRRVGWIPLSVSIVGVIISVGPQSIANIVKNAMERSVMESMNIHGYSRLPLSESDYHEWMTSLSPTKAVSMESKLRYVRSNYAYDVDGKLAKMPNNFSYIDSDNNIYFKIEIGQQTMALPANCSLIVPDAFTTGVKRVAGGHQLQFVFSYTSQGQPHTATFIVNEEILRKHSRQGKNRLVLRNSNGTTLFADSYNVQFSSDRKDVSYGNVTGVLLLGN